MKTFSPFYLILLSCLLINSSVFGQDLSANEIIKKLKNGGYVIYFRHDKTERKQIDKTRIDIDEYKKRKALGVCITQRNLSDDGKKSSRLMGQKINELGIKVSKVYSSPFCRCMDTATLLNIGRVEVANFLYFTIKSRKEDRKLNSDRLVELLSTKPEEGSNTVLVSHTSNLKEAAGIWPKTEGEAHVFQPLTPGKYKYLGKILSTDWLKIK